MVTHLKLPVVKSDKEHKGRILLLSIKGVTNTGKSNNSHYRAVTSRKKVQEKEYILPRV